MNRATKKETIKVWRLPEFDHLEMRRGWTVAAPYPKHWHDEYQLCLIEEGGGSLLWRGQSYATPAHSLFFCRARRNACQPRR